MVKLRRVYESDLYLESKKDLDDLKSFLGDKLFDDYMKIRDRIPKDYNEFKDFSKLKKMDKKDIQDFVSSFKSKSDKKKSDKTEGAEKLYEDSDWVVYRITSYPAAQLYGKNTKWCITGRYPGHEERGQEYFDSYIESNNLDGGYYFYISKKDPKKKYCILQTKDNRIHSIWDASDTNKGTSYHKIGVALPIIKEVNLSEFSVEGFDEAVRDYNIKVIKKYLENGFSIDTPLYTINNTALEWMLRIYDNKRRDKEKIADLIIFLVENGATLPEDIYLGDIVNNLDLYKYLVRHGVKINIKEEYLKNIKDLNLLDFILKEGLDLETKKVFGSKVLNDAVYDKDYDKAKICLQNGIDPNGDKDKHIPLVIAAFNNDLKIGTLLLKYGADPNLADYSAMTPFFQCLLYNYSDFLKLLLEHGADPNQKFNGLSPLYVANQIYSIDKTLIDILKKYGAKE